MSNNLGYILHPTNEQLTEFYPQIREHERGLTDVERLVRLRDSSHLAIMTYNEEMVAIVGYQVIWEGVVEVFVIPSVHVPRHRKRFFREVKGWFCTLHENHDLHRIQTYSRADPQTDSWMEHLGFVSEGTLVGYSQNKDDYRMWAKYGI